MDWDKVKDEALGILRALIRFDTSNPPGNELPAARYVAGEMRAVGLDPLVLESAPGRGNVIGRLPGNGTERPIVLIGHLDVVPVEREHWSHEPFGADIDDGFVWGRGALDMKYVVATQIACLLAMKREGVTLTRDLVVACVADEEAGGRDGARFLVEKHPGLLDAEFAMGEFGGFNMEVGGKRFYLCQTGEKGISWLRMRTSGRPGHGSMPHDRSAVIRLAEAVERLGNTPPSLRVTDTMRTMIEGLAEAVPGMEGLLDPERCDETLEALPEDMAMMMNALLRNTVTVTGLEAGYKHNVIPGHAEALLDCRLVPGQTSEDVKHQIRRTVGRAVELEETLASAPYESRFDTPLFDAMRENLESWDPGSKVLPLLLVGGTDGRYLARRGTTYYGYSPIRLPAEMKFLELVHSHDERIPVEAFREGVQVFTQTILDFCAV